VALKIKRVKVRNDKSVDMLIRDYLGEEHILWPGQEKLIMVIKPKEKKK